MSTSYKTFHTWNSLLTWAYFQVIQRIAIFRHLPSTCTSVLAPRNLFEKQKPPISFAARMGIFFFFFLRMGNLDAMLKMEACKSPLEVKYRRDWILCQFLYTTECVFSVINIKHHIFIDAQGKISNSIQVMHSAKDSCLTTLTRKPQNLTVIGMESSCLR